MTGPPDGGSLLFDSANENLGLDEESQKALFSKAERVVLSHELDKLTEEIVATRQALQLENADKQFLAGRAKELSDRLKSIKKRRRELENSTYELRLEKLIEIASKPNHARPKMPGISSSGEYEQSQDHDDFTTMGSSQFREVLDTEIEKVKASIDALENTAQQFMDQESELRAQYDISDISRSQFLAQHSDIRKRIDILHTGREILERKLKQAEDMLEEY